MDFFRTSGSESAWGEGVRGRPYTRAEGGGTPSSSVFRAVVGLVVLSVLTAWAVAVGPGNARAAGLRETKSELASAHDRLARLQGELDQLAGEYSRAEARLYQIDAAVAAAERDEARTRRDLATVRDRMSERMVRLYKSKHSAAPAFLEILFEEHDFTAVVERMRFLNTVAAQDSETFAQVGRHLRKVELLQEKLARMKADQARALAELQGARARMEGRMNAAAAEYKRLKKRVAALEEEARRAQRAAQARARNAVSSSRGATAAARGFVFPVDGPHSFINDWGFPRSGGRSHKGTDIMAARGTPVVAVVSGRIRRTAYNSGLGGTTIWLDGNNGVSYYYAHLDGIAGGVRAGVPVRAGQVIGTVGNTGNARGGAYHLHFEIHPGGGGAINPYFVLRAAD